MLLFHCSSNSDRLLCVCLTQHVDDAFVVRSKQPYGVFKEQHESRVDDTVGQLVGVGLEDRGQTGDEGKVRGGT